MAAKESFRKGAEAGWRTQGQRYMQRLIDDRELRATLLEAAASARGAYGRMNNGKGATHALFEDAKLQKELIDMANALRSASMSLTERKPKRRRRHRGRRALMLLLVGGMLAIALSPTMRSKVLDLMFGSEEEFDYISTTAPATPPPVGVTGS